MSTLNCQFIAPLVIVQKPEVLFGWKREPAVIPQRHLVLSLRDKQEQGSGMIWFICLLSLISIFIGVMVAASSEFLAARQTTDFAEQYALSIKTLLNQNPSSTLESINRNLGSQLEGKYNFHDLTVKSLRLEPGRTVHVELCVTWQSPIVFVSGDRNICEEAYSR